MTYFTNPLLNEFVEAITEMRSMQKEYDKTFRGKESKIVSEAKVDRLLLQVKKSIKKEKDAEIKAVNQELF